jgi:hypothetical protein
MGITQHYPGLTIDKLKADNSLSGRSLLKGQVLKIILEHTVTYVTTSCKAFYQGFVVLGSYERMAYRLPKALAHKKPPSLRAFLNVLPSDYRLSFVSI